ncbi:hypothetical protein DOTSEDRAFT_56916 [Dothistroma septosporum NZE10]|uniref:Uncharacterized protein n=1 Tax=Dothistroma septosporum (strain NZE10 / CBS 128990) TaxID=675120 RepID=M2YKT5_DOTSN|nr:hypothetical protein DOTSEDRAFT_56916 [Dothistroma septosporum NZE10]
MAPFSKKRKLVDRTVEELKFDNSARDEYLTGFSKRKAARKEAAKEAAIKRDKEEKVRERKQLREQRKEDLESHVAAVNDELRKQNAILNGEEDVDDFSGFEDSTPTLAPAAKEHQEELPDDAEYIDEDRYTTVTVEAMDDGKEEEFDKEEETAKYATKAQIDKKPLRKKRPWDKGGADKVKMKKKKFRYETKAERAVTRQKQKSQNKKFAKARREG